MSLSIGNARPGSGNAQQDRVAPRQVLIPIIKEHSHVSSPFHTHTHR